MCNADNKNCIKLVIKPGYYGNTCDVLWVYGLYGSGLTGRAMKSGLYAWKVLEHEVWCIIVCRISKESIQFYFNDLI